MLSGVEAIHVATVLEDCVDQLSILGRIMPASYEEKPDADEVSVLCNCLQIEIGLLEKLF